MLAAPAGSGSATAWAVLAALCLAFAVALVVPRPRRLGRPRAAPPKAARASRNLSSMRVTATVSVGLGVTVLLGGGVGLFAAPVAAGVCWWLVGRMEPPAVRRRRERLAAAVPHAVDLLAACLSAGLSPTSAVELIADAVDPPLSEELTALTARLRMGVDPATVWRDLADHPQLGSLGRTMARAVESGASVAEAMLRLADDHRRQSRAQVETKARAVGVKAAVPLGACLLPAFVLVGVVPLVAGSLSVLLQP